MLWVRRVASVSSALVVFAALSAAQSKVFVVSPTSAGKATQTFTFNSDTNIKDVIGQSQKVSGEIKFDPAKHTGSGKLVIEIKSIDTGMPVLNETMWKPEWIDAEKYPTASFETSKVKWVKGDDYDVTGKLNFHGVTKVITVRATVKYLKASEATRAAGFKGDALILKTTFPVKLEDHKVTIPERSIGTVAETITISLSVFGAAK